MADAHSYGHGNYAMEFCETDLKIVKCVINGKTKLRELRSF